MIGLKLANGRFFPILEETERIAKRVILTTVQKDQTQVKVDLYRGDVESDPNSWEYIASLVLEHIQPTSNGMPELELILRLTDTSTLDARIQDEGSGEYQSLRIDIESLEYGDFSLPEFEPPIEGSLLSPSLDQGALLGNEATEGMQAVPAPRRPFLYPALIAFVFLCLLILGILVYFIFSATRGNPPPSLVGYPFDTALYQLLI
ncbi:MAG: hypothetical protein N2442_08255 [Spirochaetes bacterium]|nr:hypothetical protein [Spirochaetota bacterium]